jgi:fibronectin type 3 domain-containing protein
VNPVFEDFKITPGQVYFYTIVAVDRDGAQSRSSEIRFIKLTPPEPEAISPPAWTLHQVRRDGIALSWAHDTPDHI